MKGANSDWLLNRFNLLQPLAREPVSAEMNEVLDQRMAVRGMIPIAIPARWW
jgi:hypothetical protein